MVFLSVDARTDRVEEDGQSKLPALTSHSITLRYFHPLKEVAAPNAGLPLWWGTGLPVASRLPPRSWTQVAAEFLDGPIRGMMRPASFGLTNAS